MSEVPPPAGAGPSAAAQAHAAPFKGGLNPPSKVGLKGGFKTPFETPLVSNPP